MHNPLFAYYRIPERYQAFVENGMPPKSSGYFRFGNNILYGKLNGNGVTARSPTESLRDVLSKALVADGRVSLPFDPGSVVQNLQQERYGCADLKHPADSLIGRAYYLARPALPVGFRKYLQEFRLKGWTQLAFPTWPVDRTVDETLEALLLLTLRANKLKEVPFIWFWPEGASSACIMTHDVETQFGRDSCSTLMDIDQGFGIRASFQVVPEQRYKVSSTYLESIRNRGFEVCVHDLDHDGRLYRDKTTFLSRVSKINAYGREWGARGFRAGVLYRRQEWFDALDFDYDMSVPNVAHLDPQRGGCCTVMPYFVGNILEIPVTLIQDYSLFHILREYSIDLWKQQIALIMEKHGLLSFIAHPDYILSAKEQAVYTSLLRYIAELRDEQQLWCALPRDINQWWRHRAKMRLVDTPNGWRVEGRGSERARIAFAREQNGALKISLGQAKGHFA